MSLTSENIVNKVINKFKGQKEIERRKFQAICTYGYIQYCGYLILSSDAAGWEAMWSGE